MKKGEVIQEEVVIEKLIPGGQGIGTLKNGKKIFLWNALPQETITRWQITKCKNNYIEGIALDINHHNPARVTPKDECYLSTSPWQNMQYHFELEQKFALLIEIFRQAKIEFQDKSRNDSQVFGLKIDTVQTDYRDYYYRNKMEYSLYYDNNQDIIKPAFRRRGSHQKVAINQSSIEMPEIWQAANNIIQELNLKHEDARKYQSLLLRCNQEGMVSGGLYENYQPHPQFSSLKDKISGSQYSYSPNGFFQINLPVYEMALKEISRHIQSKSVLDLYAGVGTIGLSVAKEKNLVLVECDKAAYAELERNCHDKTWATPILAKSEEALSYITPQQTVILDPPRAGCDQKLIEKLLQETPEKIIYLSCNPSTQARDIKSLVTNDMYNITKVILFNFFPHTPHLENLVILERR